MGNWTGEDYINRDDDFGELIHVMVCQIYVWEANQSDNSNGPAGTLFTEVSSVEINQSYKNLVDTATIEIPRGAIMSKTIVSDNVDMSVKTGNFTNDKSETSVDRSTSTGQASIPGDSVSTSGETTLSMQGNRDDIGFVEINRKKDRLVTQHDFAVGNRIEIRLGYVNQSGNEPDDPDDDIFARARRGEELGLDVCFRGFIKSCTATTPLRINCEGMGSKLMKVRCPNHQAKGDYTVNDLFADNGKFHLLSGTGIKLSPITQSMGINVGKINMSTNVTVADICKELSKCGLVSFIDQEGDLRIGRLLYSGSKVEGNKQYITYSKSNDVKIIQFDWDVASDSLQVTKIDKNFLAVKAQAWKFSTDGKNHLMRVTVRKAKQDTEGAEEGFIFSNVHDGEMKYWGKKKGGTKGDVKNFSDLDGYTVVPYISPNRNITMNDLKEEAKTYFRKYSTTGISGSISIFGDKFIYPSECVMLIDPRLQEKNGLYLVESVTTIFSATSGFRRELKLPYKIMNYNGKLQYIE